MFTHCVVECGKENLNETKRGFFLLGVDCVFLQRDLFLKSGNIPVHGKYGRKFLMDGTQIVQ